MSRVEKYQPLPKILGNGGEALELVALNMENSLPKILGKGKGFSDATFQIER
jgi:hypothetical protein